MKRIKVLLFTALFSAMSGGFFGYYLTTVRAAQKIITSGVDFNSGLFDGTESRTREGELKLTASGTWNPRVFKTPNVALTNQSAIVSDGENVYLLAGGDRYFAKYISSEDRWITLANAPHLAYNGTDLVILDGYIYAIYGSYTKNFSRYRITTNTWEDLGDVPELMADGASIETDGTDLYILRGTSTYDFWKYEIVNQKWSTLTQPPATIGAGANLVYKNGYFYTPRGASSTTFYRFNPNVGVGGSWAAMPVIPGTVGTNHNSAVLGDYIYVNRDLNTSSLYRFNVGTTAWETLTSAPQLSQYVGVVGVGDTATGFVYVFRGNSTYDFWKYNPRNNSFLGLTDLPNTPSTGADFTYLNNWVYFRRGASSASFYGYNTAVGGTWVTLANTPATFADDVKGVRVGNYLYHLRGGGTTSFYRYDPSVGVGGTWVTMLATPASLTINYGSALVYPGSGDYIYATRGGLSRTFMRYTIGVGETWDDAVVADLPDDAEAGYGSRMISDGTDIYYIAGNGMSRIYKYIISGVGANTWVELGSTPFAPYLGTDISYYNGKIYILAGNLKSDYWEYTIGNNTWRQLSSLQDYGPLGIGASNGAAIVNDGNGNFYMEAGIGNSRFFSYSVGSSNYPTSGSWTSLTQDLGYISNWSSLEIGSEILSGTGISWETRSSSDQISWEEWRVGVGTSITSTPNRYIQVKITLTSNGNETPILKSININYEGDTTSPSNPTSVTGWSQQVLGVGLTSGNTYSYLSPYFTWDGASDDETNIVGYYVYFGLGETADPEISGSYRVSNEYLVGEPMDHGTYYLRLKTVNGAGLKSEAMTAFVYRYNGIAPPSSLEKSFSTDFDLGQKENVNTENNQIKLASKASFWQEDRLSPLSGTINYGSGFAYSASRNKLYILRGANTNSFYQYDLVTNIGSTLANAPGLAYYGSDLVEGPSGYLYALRGNVSTGFWRYDLNTGTWSDELAEDTPQPVTYGGSLVYDNERYIYALKGNGDDTFMKYDTLTDDWEVLTDANTDFGAPNEQVNNNIGNGADLVFDGENKIYAIQGGTKNGFAVYNTSSGKWQRLQNLPMIANYGAQIEFDIDNKTIYYLPGFAKTFFYKYDLSTEQWSELAEVPYPVGAGAALKKVDGDLYLAVGGSSANLYKYNITKNVWTVPTMGLFRSLYRGVGSHNFYYGADIVKGDGDNYYMTRGNYDNLFVRYNSENGEITKMADAPAGFYQGGDLVYDSVNNKIYAIANQYFRKLFVYDITTDVWGEEVSDPPPLDPADGGSMTFDGVRYIYWARGGTTNSFYRFDTQGVGTSKWSVQPNAFATIGSGGDIVAKGDFVYALRGVGTTAFLRYEIGTTTWSNAAVADLPAGMTVTTDGFLIDLGGDKLMACRGNNTNTCYEYSINGDSWSLVDGTFGPYIYRGGAAASNGNNRALIIPGNGALGTPNNGVYGFVSQSSDSSFEETGNYISPSHDLGAVYRFANIEIGVSMQTNTDLLVYTKTSSDDDEWEEWVLASDKKIIGTDWVYKVNSEPNKYIMVKLVLTSSDGIKTGIINGYRINYYEDEIEPTNPTELNIYQSLDRGSTLVSGVWNNSTAPFVEWSGATDGENGSGVAGYYAYFGLGETSDPAVLGTYTTATNIVGVGLTSGNTYYFKIKTKDNANNVTNDIGTTFIYKFDNIGPSNPVTISADPPGYTATNSFTFTWLGATDVGSSIAAYCYKVGVEGSETCVEGGGTTGVTGIMASQTGTNTFYLKTKDVAGNYAPNWMTASFYYSSIAPGAPMNLNVGPTSNTVNEFAFTWQPPTLFYGQQTGLRYYYSINELPTASNVNKVGLSVTYLSKGSYATRKDSNTMYVVAMDEAGNIDYNNYTSVDFEAKTSAPGIPLNIDISDVSVKETSNWRLAISWETPEASGSGIADYKIYRSTITGAECSSDMENFNQVSSTTSESFVDTNLGQIKYYYCVMACDSTNQCSAPSSTVSLLPDGKWRVPPTLIGEPSATAKTKSAIVTWSTSRTSSSFVKYGKSSGAFGDEVGTSEQVAAHSISLTGLDPGTTYYYKTLWTDEDGNTGESTEATFTTNPAPTISTVKISDVSLYSAYITFTIKSAIKATIQYGLTTNYGEAVEISTSTSENQNSIKLENLTQGSKYHLRIQAYDEENNIFTSDDYIFETLPLPKLLNIKVQQVKGMPTATLRLLWQSNTNVSSLVSYFPTGKAEMIKDQVKLTLTKNHEIVLSDLADDTEYTLVIKGKDKMGNNAETVTQKIKTSADMRSPTISNINIETVVSGLGDEAKAQIIISWDTDEPATSQIEYGQGTGSDYPNKTQKDSNLTLNHSVTISDLKPTQVYHLRILTEDKRANLSQSYDNVVITPKETSSALNLVIQNLSKSFGFINNFGGKK